jgi:transposase-like protein
MKKVPNGRYTKEFRAEAVKLVTEGGFTAYEASRRLSVPKSTLENWVRAEKKGVLGAVGKTPLSKSSPSLSARRRLQHREAAQMEA